MLSLVVVQARDRRPRFGGTRSLSLPASAIIDEHAEPLISSSGKVGFISSVTGGSVISFSVSSGRLLSPISGGETVGPITMVEAAGRRLVAAPAVNDPGHGHPAAVSIIDATRSR